MEFWSLGSTGFWGVDTVRRSSWVRMFHKRFHAPGTPPATLVPAESISGEPPKITLIEYDAAGFEERKLARIEEAFVCRDNGKTSWINIDGLSDPELLRALGRHFGLHPLALEDVLNVGQRPKIEEYNGHFFMVAQMTYLDAGGAVEGEQVSLFLGPNFLITIQEEATRDLFEPVRQRLRSGRGVIRGMGHDYLAYALVDALVDHFFPILERIGEGIEEMEDELLAAPTRESVGRLHQLKRVLLHLRRVVWPTREITAMLNRDETGLIKRETKVFLRDCYDHTVQLMDVIDNYREATAGMMELYLSSVSIRTNEIMRVLTVITVIFIPLNFIAGVYGMNFENMPELQTRYGYFVVVGLMLTLAVALLALFKKKGWL
jgi:magnesium transporter